MLLFVLAFIFFALLAVVYELHFVTERLIELGTIVEHFNRRDLRAAKVPDTFDDDFATESIRKTHRTWAQVVWAIVVAAVLSGAVLKGIETIAVR